LKALWVFGSYARGEATEESDVDFLMDYTDSIIKDLPGYSDYVRKNIFPTLLSDYVSKLIFQGFHK
jgi:predicted nucleotidyltransferase